MSVPAAFEYRLPKSVKEAVALLHENKGARPLAGGHELLTRLKLRRESADLLVDLRDIPDLRRMGTSADGTGFSIGAMVTCNELCGRVGDMPGFDVLVEAANSIGDAQVRNCTTVGGNIGGGNPAADLAAALLALDARLTIVGHFGTREVLADQFYVGPFDTVLESDEIITQIVVPFRQQATFGAYEKIRNAANSYPLCGAAVTMSFTDKKAVADCCIAITGATIHPVRLSGVEFAMNGRKADAAVIVEASRHAVQNQTFASDHAAAADYRAHLAIVLVEKALTRAASAAAA